MDSKASEDPFPIQGGHVGRQEFRRTHIPWWLARVAYKEYSDRFGTDQSLERLAERGGFGRGELLMLLRRERRPDYEQGPEEETVMV